MSDTRFQNSRVETAIVDEGGKQYLVYKKVVARNAIMLIEDIQSRERITPYEVRDELSNDLDIDVDARIKFLIQKLEERG
ncbi:hypothetical protein SAMN05421781_0512 [Marinococcus luteus]|uniref:Uncharacterized protein n=1 Tax=Marinococcus luteus TaxID=1122204 RepID=A0A1H2R048_9BACI|nr:hypothetical protein [Marinococcus luteus]SDW12049.1 hypothetical protein SAMN05421781_0512 [Marinococcus luteus]